MLQFFVGRRRTAGVLAGSTSLSISTAGTLVGNGALAGSTTLTIGSVIVVSASGVATLYVTAMSSFVQGACSIQSHN